MHQDPEHNDYDDDDYNYYPEYNEYGFPYSKKFQVDWAAWEAWLSETIKEIVNEEDNVWVFGNQKNNKKLNDKHFMYLGVNQYDETLWKTKYFINNKLNQQYKSHLAFNAAHVVRQPNHYRSLFDILN